MSETQAGSILAVLSLSITDFETNIEKAQELADHLDGKNVNVQVKVDTAGAETKLAAVAASEDKVSGSSKGASGGLSSVESAARKLADASAVANIAQLRLSEAQKSGTAKASSLASAHQSVTKAQRDLTAAMASSTPEIISAANAMKQVDDSNKKVASSSKDAGKGLGLMSMAIVGLGPAIVPIAAGAAGLAVGFGAMGAAGLLAFLGIREQMAAGTPLGAEYTSMVGTLTGDLHQLGATAATGVLAPLQTEVEHLQGQMPALNSIIGEFSVITGKTAGNLMQGLVAAFIQLEPLARDVGVYVLDLSSKFASMMSGPGVVTFGDYIRSVFPQVMATVESVVTAAVHLIAALAPLGGGSLSMLKAFSDVIAAMPVNVLTALVTVAGPLFVGFKAFSMLSGGIAAVGVALKAVGISADTAAAGMLTMNIAAGAVGAIITLAMLAFTAFSGQSQQATQATNDLTDALIRSKGVIDQTIISDKAAALAKDGTLASAKLLNISYGDMTNAALGLAGPLATVNAALAKTGFEGGHATNSTGPLADAYDKVSAATAGAATRLDTATVAAKAAAAATNTSAAAAVTLTTATLLGMNAQQQSESTNKTQIATIQALNTAMDAELGLQNSLAGAQTGVDQAMLTMNTTLATNKGSLDSHTQAGLDDQKAIEGVASSLESQRQANIKAGDSTAQATVKYQASAAALLDQTGKIDGTSSAAYILMQRLLGIPADVQVQITAATAPATAAANALQTRIDDIKQGHVPGIDADSTAGKAVIASLQSGIDNIKQGKPPGVTADITPAQAETASAQGLIDRIHQGQVPGLNVNPQAANNAIRNTQDKIDSMQGKNISIDVSFNTATNSFINKPPTWGPVTKAAGGPISGPGSGTSDEVPILASNGEHMLTASDVNAAGGHGAVMAWRNSLHGPAHAVIAGVQALAAGGPLLLPAGLSPDSQVNSLKKVLL